MFKSSRSNSRASTPLSQKSTSRKGHPKNSKQDTTAGKSLEKRKKFHMVLEKDDDYEVDYLTPDDVRSKVLVICLCVINLFTTAFGNFSKPLFRAGVCNLF